MVVCLSTKQLNNFGEKNIELHKTPLKVNGRSLVVQKRDFQVKFQKGKFLKAFKNQKLDFIK